MMTLTPDENDSQGFLNAVDQIINGFVHATSPQRFVVLKIKNWFGEKWLGFSGKVLGAMGVWKNNITIPPFVPSRVLSQVMFKRSDDGDYQIRPSKRIHRWQSSGRNLSKKVLVWIPDDCTVFWYSSNTAQNTRGSLMTYVVKGDNPWIWYVEFQQSKEWSVVRLRNISDAEVKSYAKSSRQ